jgi:Tfp pilus assembly protein PilF
LPSLLPPRRLFRAGFAQMSNRITSLKQKANAAYIAGNLDQAARIQQQVIDEAVRLGRSCAEHYLVLAMYLFERKSFSESLEWLQKAAKIWPLNSEIAENTGVLLLRVLRWEEARQELERAIALRSESPNVFDSLCHCFGSLNDFKNMQIYGRRALEVKSQTSLAAKLPHPLPSQAPPSFDQRRRNENVITYSLWGNDERYIVPLLENLKLAPHLFPGWTIRIYIDKSVSETTRGQLTNGVQF